MRITEQGQITIPQELRDQFGLDCDADVEVVATKEGVLIRRRDGDDNPFDRAYGILSRVDHSGVPITSTDDYMREIRGR